MYMYSILWHIILSDHHGLGSEFDVSIPNCANISPTLVLDVNLHYKVKLAWPKSHFYSVYVYSSI